jgi:hypothetical protein
VIRFIVLGFAGPDIVASILLTGKVPRLQKAIAVVPHGKQEGLRSVSLRGMVEIDANKHSFFKHVIEQRAAHESDPALHYWLKILANSGSYGLFVELNPNEANNASLKVFSGEESFETTSDVIEEPGDWFAPHVASSITAGGRLLLAMLEKCIADAGGTYLFCDTDSAAIVSTKRRQQIPMPDGAAPITALSHHDVDEIVQRFEALNPYDLKGSILKIHKLNWDENGQRQQLHSASSCVATPRSSVASAVLCFITLTTNRCRCPRNTICGLSSMTQISSLTTDLGRIRLSGGPTTRPASSTTF